MNIRLKENKKTESKAIEYMDSIMPEFVTNLDEDFEYKEIMDNYKLYNNVLDQDELKKCFNQIGIQNLNIADIKPYNKTYLYAQVLLGEELKRGDYLRPVIMSQEGQKQKDLELREAYQRSVQQELEKVIEKVQMQMQGASEEEIQQRMQEMTAFMTPDDIDVNNYMSELEISISKLLKYAEFKHDIKTLKNEGFFHSIISDIECFYISTDHEGPFLRLVNPPYLFYDKSPNTKYIQHGDYAGQRFVMTIADILGYYGDALKAQDLKYLTETYDKSNLYYGKPDKLMKYHMEKTPTHRRLNKSYAKDDQELEGLYGRSNNSRTDFYNEELSVVHMEWKWLRKIGFLNTLDIEGNENTVIVGEEFEHPEDAQEIEFTNRFGIKNTLYEWMEETPEGVVLMNIEYMWIPDIWEGTRIDNAIYVNVRRKPNQFVSMENPFRYKLGYHGRKYTATNARSISLFSRMKPFQYLYFVTLHQLGELVVRNRGPIQDIDVAQIDLTLGNGNVEEALQVVLAYQQKGYNLYNSMNGTQGSMQNTTGRPQPGRINNASTSQDIVNLINILDWLERQIGMAIGVSPQRAAQFSPNSNVTDNQQSIAQSSHMTEIYFHYHNRLWAEIMDSYLTLFRRWAINQFRRTDSSEISLSYIMPDQSIEVLKLTPEKLTNSDIGIFTTSSGADNDYFMKMESLVMAFAQNNMASSSDISNILKARAQGTSPEEVHKMIEVAEEKKQKRDEKLQQMQQEQNQQTLKMQQEMAAEAHEREKELIVLKAEEDRKTKLLTADFDDDSDGNSINDLIELKKLSDEKEMHDKDLQVKREEIKSKEKIAAMKPKPAK